VASYYFDAAWDWRFLGLLIASTLVDFTCGLWLGRSLSPARRRALLCLSLGFNLVLLGFFKYFNFFADSLDTVFGALGWQLDFVTVRVLLPIGISFYTFVTMSYVIDVYRRDIPPTRSLLSPTWSSTPPSTTPASTSCSAHTPSPSRSTAISRAIRTLRGVRRS
jgi:alginate O-acetyltransferase complex protein AlgI